VDIDMSTRLERRELPIILVDQREPLGIIAEIVDPRDNGRDGLDRVRS